MPGPEQNTQTRSHGEEWHSLKDNVFRESESQDMNKCESSTDLRTRLNKHSRQRAHPELGHHKSHPGHKAESLPKANMRNKGKSGTDSARRWNTNHTFPKDVMK